MPGPVAQPILGKNLAAWALRQWDYLHNADVIVLLTDSRSPGDIPHLGHTLPWWQDRMQWAGPDRERRVCIWPL